MTDRNKISSVIAFLRRTKSQAEIEQLAIDAFAAVHSGVVLTSVSFEGGSGQGTLDFPPSQLLEACETVLADMLGTATAGRVVFAQYGGQLLQT